MHALRHNRQRHDGLDVLVLEFGDVDTAEARDELLTDGVRAVIAELVELSGSATVGVALDLRAPSGLAAAAAAHVEAFAAACHGLVHAYVAEERTAIPPVNLVVSWPVQEHDRERTLDYLAAEDGQFARGAAFDLRDAA